MSSPPNKRKQPESNHSISNDDVQRAAELLVMISRYYFAQVGYVAPERAQSEGETKVTQEKPNYQRGTPEKVKRQGDAKIKSEKLKSQGGERLHQCTLCPKSFLSGQALGGHQRQHYQGIIKKKKVENKNCVDNIDLKKKVENKNCDINLDLKKNVENKNCDINIDLKKKVENMNCDINIDLKMKVENKNFDLNIDLNEPAPGMEIEESSSTQKDEEEIGEKSTKGYEKEEETTGGS